MGTEYIDGKLEVDGKVHLIDDLAVEGILKNGRTFYNVASLAAHTEALKEIVIKTKIPFLHSNIMPLIHLKGYSYSEGSPIDLSVVFYIFKDGFSGARALSAGGCKHAVFLSTYTENEQEYVAVSLDVTNVYTYFPRFAVDFTDLWRDEDGRAEYDQGWTIETSLNTDVESIIPSDRKVEVQYIPIASDISGKAAAAERAAKAIADDNGNNIVNTYLKKTGGTMTGDLILTNNQVIADKFVGELSGSLELKGSVGTNKENKDLIWHVYNWELKTAYAGHTGTYNVVDTNENFNGILAVRASTSSSATSLAVYNVTWLAANTAPPAATLTYTVNSSSVTYRLYVKYPAGWNNLKISTISEDNVNTVVETFADVQVTSISGTEASKSDTIVAESAKKLQTPRSISLNGGAGSDTIWFDGTGNAPITVTEVKESFLAWGGRSISGAVSPIDAAMSDVHRANRLAFSDPKGITVEYSRDGGATYTPYETEDGNNAKIDLVSGIGYSYAIGGRSGGNSIDDKLRVTLNAIDMGVYCWAKKLLLYVTSSTNTASVTIEEATVAAPDTWITVGTYPVSGWSGWNSIPLLRVFGTNGADSTQKHLLRLTFGITALNADASFAFTLSKILLLADTAWNTPSEMARTGHLYGYNASQRAIFPADVQAVTFHGALNGKASSAAAADTLFDTSMNTGFMKGSATQPVYFDNGVPVACSYSIAASVPADAKFTDTIFTGGNVSKHIYLTGAQAASNTASTSQIVFGTEGNNHVALSSNTHALVINPSTSQTTNQIVLYLDKPSVFPSGIKANLTGNATTATTATKLGSDNVGGATKPIYLSGGAPMPCTYSLDLATTKAEGVNIINTPGLVQSGGDVTIVDGIITVNDDSHNHIIANVDGLQTELNKLDTRITNIVAPTGAGWELLCENQTAAGLAPAIITTHRTESLAGYEYMFIFRTEPGFNTMTPTYATSMLPWPESCDIFSHQLVGSAAYCLFESNAGQTEKFAPCIPIFATDSMSDLTFTFQVLSTEVKYDSSTGLTITVYRRKILY